MFYFESIASFANPMIFQIWASSVKMSPYLKFYSCLLSTYPAFSFVKNHTICLLAVDNWPFFLVSCNTVSRMCYNFISMTVISTAASTYILEILIKIMLINTYFIAEKIICIIKSDTMDISEESIVDFVIIVYSE